jgi:hypothetical protein
MKRKVFYLRSIVAVYHEFGCEKFCQLAAYSAWFLAHEPVADVPVLY